MPAFPRRRLRTGALATTVLTTGALSAGLPVLAAAPAHSTTTSPVVRMTAHTAPVVDADGNVWAARSSTLGTTKLSTRLVGQDVAGTTDDVLYQKNAWGATGYSSAVPMPGTYRVRILMAEDSFAAAGQRVFDVSAEGTTTAKDVDIAKAVGKGAAHDVTFEVFVADGRLDLTFTKKVDQPLVSAIEVTRVGGLAEGDAFDLRMSSRSEVLEYGGHTWYPSYGWSGAPRQSMSLENEPVGSTDADILYRTQTWGMTGWRAEVPEPGLYTVQLFTTEGKFTEVGSRVFDVLAEGRTVLSNADIYKAVGVRTAYAPKFDVTVTDGVLDLGFVNKVDYATIGSIRVTRAADTSPVVKPASVPTPTPSPTPSESPSGTGGTVTKRMFESRMAARPYPLTDTAGRVWDRWSPSLGSWRLSQRLVGKSVSGTGEPELYSTNVWGAGGYSLPVSDDVATYRVRLLLAEDSFPSAGQRVFDVKAEGKTVVTGVDVAKAVGIGHAHDVTFTTEVRDGLLSLDFVKRIDQPLVSAIEVTSTEAVTPPSTAPRRIVPVSPQAFWTKKITTAPVASNSAQVVASLKDDVDNRYGGIGGFNAYEFTAGHHVAEQDAPRVTVDRSCGTSWTPGVYDGAAHFLDVPVPSDAVPAVGSDAHMSIYDPVSDKLWSFWQMRRNATTHRWSACWGGRIDDVSKSEGVFPEGYGAAASGLAMPPGMVTQDEVRRGRIDHAIAIVVPNARKGAYSWPANRTDGISDSPDAVMQGQRLRLDPTLNLDEYDLTPLGRMIAMAAQEYGFVPIDTAGGVSVLGQAGDLEESQTGTNPWRALVGDRQWEVMRNFPWGELEALPKDYGRP